MLPGGRDEEPRLDPTPGRATNAGPPACVARRGIELRLLPHAARAPMSVFRSLRGRPAARPPLARRATPVPAHTGAPGASIPRRAVLAALGALAGCGFTPALAPGGQGRFIVEAPATRAGFVLRGQLLDRLGTPGAGAPYRLAVELAVDPGVAAVDPAQVTTRVRLEGAATFVVTEAATERVILRGSASSFASYDATGTTVSLAASARDAEARLATILADRIAARLLAADLP